MTRQVSSNMYERWIVVSTLFFAMVFVFAFSASAAWAQATASLNGTVRDSAGAVVTEATVVLPFNATAPLPVVKVPVPFCVTLLFAAIVRLPFEVMPFVPDEIDVAPVCVMLPVVAMPPELVSLPV